MQDTDRSWLEVPAAADGTTIRSVLERVKARPAVATALAVSGLFAALIAGAALSATSATPRIDLGAIGSTSTAAASTADVVGGALVVDVAGAVRRPGVYHLAAGSRVGDAIEAAGGFAPTVDTQAAAKDLNLAAALIDGQKVVVPTRGAATPADPAGTGAGGLVDLNHASESELDALPGIGPVTAAKIIASRNERPFSDPKELVDRKLVGQKTWEKLRDLVTVG
jgi:competence protein ComEA